MSTELYPLSIPVLQRALGSLKHILQTGAAHAEATAIEAGVLEAARLHPTMRPLSFQVQVACDVSKGCGARLAGIEAPSFADTETRFEELIERVDKTLAFLDTLSPEQINGQESRAVTLKLRSGEMNFDGLAYLQGFVLPNVYFHISTAYSILRHNGVPLGKADFLSGLRK